MSSPAFSRLAISLALISSLGATSCKKLFGPSKEERARCGAARSGRDVAWLQASIQLNTLERAWRPHTTAIEPALAQLVGRRETTDRAAIARTATALHDGIETFVTGLALGGAALEALRPARNGPTAAFVVAARPAIAAVDAVKTSGNAIGDLRVAFVKAIVPALKEDYDGDIALYNRIKTGLARNPELGSPLMDQLSTIESILETGAEIRENPEQSFLFASGLDWTGKTPLRNPDQRPQYGSYRAVNGTPAQFDARIAEFQRRETELTTALTLQAAALGALPADALAALEGVRGKAEAAAAACVDVDLAEARK